MHSGYTIIEAEPMNKLVKKIEALSEEASQLMQLRAQYDNRIRELEVRLHQIAGAIAELDAIIKEDRGGDD